MTRMRSACADARQELRIDADADVAGIAVMAVVEAVLAAEGAADRQIARLGEALQGAQAAAVLQRLPPTMTKRPLGGGEHVANLHRSRPGPDARGPARGASAHRTAPSGRACPRAAQARPGPGRPCIAGEGARHVLRDARRVVDLRHPLGELAEHAAEVDLLEGLAVALVARRPGRRRGSSAWNPGMRCATPDAALVAPGRA